MITMIINIKVMITMIINIMVMITMIINLMVMITMMINTMVMLTSSRGRDFSSSSALSFIHCSSNCKNYPHRHITNYIL